MLQSINPFENSKYPFSFKLTSFIVIPKLLIIDCLKYKPHPTHLSFKKCLFYINLLKDKYIIDDDINYYIDELQEKIEK